MNSYIDLYCERILPGLLGEPLNALSNLSFFVAAWAIWRLAQYQMKEPLSIWILITLAIAIGTGSTLFHTFATEWASLLDMIPILLFQLCFLWFYSNQVTGMKYRYIGLLILSFLYASSFSSQFTSLLNGSLSYAPTLLALLSFGLYHYQKQKREPYILLAASGIFLLALLFRTLDQSICSHWSVGTHFLWHLCNGLLLYLSARSLILNSSPKVACVNSKR
jgi:Ceramidase